MNEWEEEESIPTHATIISTAIDILGVTGALLVAGVFFFCYDRIRVAPLASRRKSLRSINELPNLTGLPSPGDDDGRQ
ncbi:hypothetical protein D9D10_00730 [Raoultella ornithinolytica]|nr:hypothetical protein D9D10_00730 [Raoultella ornithinolytica]